MEEQKQINLKTQRNSKARAGECLGTLLIIVGLFSFLGSTTAGIILLLVGFAVFLFGRFNE